MTRPTRTKQRRSEYYKGADDRDKTSVVSVRLPRVTAEVFRRRADKFGVSQNKLLIRLVEEWIRTGDVFDLRKIGRE